MALLCVLHELASGLSWDKLNRVKVGGRQPSQWLRALERDMSNLRKALPAAEGATCMVCHCPGGALQEHPLLAYSLCGECHEAYSTHEWTLDADGTEAHCRGCAYGGRLFACGAPECCFAFCESCIITLCGDAGIEKCAADEEWQCPLCHKEGCREGWEARLSPARWHFG